MGKNKKEKTHAKKEKGRSKFVSLLIVIVVFTVAFIVLIKNQQQDSYQYNVKDNAFSVKAEYGKTIVAKDTKVLYPKYYVVSFSGDEYSVYEYNYYETESQYELEFNRLLDQIVDYNADDKMIRCIDTRGYGTYEEVYNNLTRILGNDDIKIY